jgi:hypothetical protein
MHIRNGLKAVRNVVLSGAKYFALSTYPAVSEHSVKIVRSIESNNSLVNVSIQCQTKDYCQLGAISDGGFYTNNINCHPFNFPLSKALLIQPSHQTFPIESDQIHIYPIDDELKNIVKRYDQACV